MPNMSTSSLRDLPTHETSGEEQASGPDTVTSKVDYTQGFGSFLFEYQCAGEVEKVRASIERPVSDEDEDSGTIRKSPKTGTAFPLFKLPLEIRRMIYRYLVDDLSFRPDEGLQFIMTTLDGPSHWNPDDPPRYDKNMKSIPPFFVLEAPDQRTQIPNTIFTTNTDILDVLGVYRSIAHPSYPQAAGTPTAAEQPELYSEILSRDADAESDEAEFTDGDSDYDTSSWCSEDAEVIVNQRLRHECQTDDGGLFPDDSDVYMDSEHEHGTESTPASPSSSVFTTIGIHAAKDAKLHQKQFHLGKAAEAGATILSLSLTSAGIALELGEVLWANAKVYFETPECFLAFARDRPAALSFIRAITVALNIETPGQMPKCTTHSLAAMMRMISERCRLDSLTLMLPFSEWGPFDDYSWNCTGRRDWMQEWRLDIRKLHVTGELRVACFQLNKSIHSDPSPPSTMQLRLPDFLAQWRPETWDPAADIEGVSVYRVTGVKGLLTFRA